MKFFDFKRWENKRVAVHCATKEEAVDFCKKMHRLRRTWKTGESYRKTYWDYLKENTCYDNEGEFSSITYYKNRDYIILEWKDYMNNFKKSDLKNGDVILKRNGSVEIICVDTGVSISPNGINFLEYIKEDLTNSLDEKFDIIEVYRPEESWQCSFLAENFQEGNLVYYRESDSIEITLEEIAELKEVPVDKIKIVF